MGPTRQGLLCRAAAAGSFALGAALLLSTLHPQPPPEPPPPPRAPLAAAPPPQQEAAPPRSRAPAPERGGEQGAGAGYGGYLGEEELPAELRAKAQEHRDACAAAGAVDPGGGAAEEVPGSGPEALSLPRLDASVRLTSLQGSALLLPDAPLRTGAAGTGLIVARDAEGRRVCRGGDMLEARLAAADEHEAPRVSDLGHGLYALSFSPRLPGPRRLCLHLYYPGRLRGLPRWPSGRPRPFRFPAHFATFKAAENITRLFGPLSDWCQGREPDLRPRCFDLQVAGPPVLPAAPCPDSWDGGLPGSWLRMPAPGVCSPGWCEGDLKFLDSDRWVYVPFQCYLRLYNREAAWNCLDNRSLLWFGDSTLRQSATNLVELVLGTPVLGDKSFKWVYAHCSRWVLPRGFLRMRGTARRLSLAGKEAAKRGCPDYNSIRIWGGPRPNPENPKQRVHVRFVWGGGWAKNTLWGIRPAALDHSLPDRGSGDQWTCRGGPHGGCSPSRKDLLAALDGSSGPVPDVAFLNGFLWDQDANEWGRFEPKVAALMRLLTARMPRGARIHWNAAHPQCLDDRREELESICRSALVNKMQTVLAAHSNAMVNQAIAAASRSSGARVSATDRIAAAQPYVHGHEFCHQGMHFGSSKQDCWLFDSLVPEPCFRQWRVDKFLSQIWLNAACPPDRAPPFPSGNHTIEDGVPKATGNWLPRRQGNPEPEA
eukprot:TRINITY_DN23210_c0_g1_i1.p1 TRINITY_DN23210_c0_g1~~TRINITY_DN23210_c0_g1_i1.p1  ORF type:complete len:742 (+),score=230.27 TRINITY_DN23210_c0_g1_i1:98-2227(+)